MKIFFKKTTIIGLGLIGGSLARALRRKGLTSEITGVGRGIENLETGISLGIIDNYSTDPIKGIKDADVVILATPVATIVDILKKICAYLNDDTIVSDVGSVKGSIIKKIESFIPDKFLFVGAHPIAGTEDSGVKASFAELFIGRKCILTPTEKTDKKSLEIIKAMWESVGSDVILMDPDRHDTIMAAVSHLPHIIAYSLVNTIDDFRDFEKDLLSFSAGGFRDTTRIALSHPVIWKDICLFNKEAILNMIERYQDTLSRLKSLIENDEASSLIKEFERSVKTRREIV
jgi:prephenate dehydrogenase